jgi:glycosyltransferase involved in cell wall biosynthesis
MLAIVIPYYKITFFEATLQSLANQTDKRFRVYIGDDASPENPIDLLEKYKGNFEFVYKRYESNLGATSLIQQWERCIALSVHEQWLMILGDDDVLGDNVIEELYAFIDKRKEAVDLIRFNLRIIDQYGKLKSSDLAQQVYERTNNLLERILSRKEAIRATEFVFSRNVYNLFNGFIDFPLAWFSDYATWLNFSKKSGIYYIKEASVYWRLSEINISSKSVSIREIELKVKSLFLFMCFLQHNFYIDEKTQKRYMFENLNYLLSNIFFCQVLKILWGNLFKSKFRLADIIIIEFVLKKINRKLKYFFTTQTKLKYLII